MLNLVKIAQGVTSPYIAKVTTHFFLYFFVCKIIPRPVNRFWHAIQQRTRIYAEKCLVGLTAQYSQTFKTTKTFWVHTMESQCQTHIPQCIQLRRWHLVNCFIFLNRPTWGTHKSISIRRAAGVTSLLIVGWTIMLRYGRWWLSHCNDMVGRREGQGWGDGATAPARRRALRATWRNNSSYTLELKCLAYDVRIYQNCTN